MFEFLDLLWLIFLLVVIVPFTVVGLFVSIAFGVSVFSYTKSGKNERPQPF